MDDIIRVPTYVERAGDGGWDLLITCPHCDDLHRHGGGNGPVPRLGHRVSHCIRRVCGGDYVLIPGPVDMPRPVAKTGAWRRKQVTSAENSGAVA